MDYLYVRRMRLELTRRNRHYPLKVACLPISPPGHCIPEATFGSANIDTILRFAKFLREKRQNLRNACGGAPARPTERPPPI